MKIIASCTCRIPLFQHQLFEPSFETSVSSGNALFALKLVYLYLLHAWLSWRVMLWRKQKPSLGTVRYELTVAKHRRTCQLTKCPQPETVAPLSRTTWPYQTHVAPVSRTKWPSQDTVASFSRTTWPYQTNVAPERRTKWPYQRNGAPSSRTKWPYQNTVAPFGRTKCP